MPQTFRNGAVVVKQYDIGIFAHYFYNERFFAQRFKFCTAQYLYFYNALERFERYAFYLSAAYVFSQMHKKRRGGNRIFERSFRQVATRRLRVCRQIKALVFSARTDKKRNGVAHRHCYFIYSSAAQQVIEFLYDVKVIQRVRGHIENSLA